MFKVLVVLLTMQESGLAMIDAPSDQEILRAMPRLTEGISYVFEEFRDDIVITKTVLVCRQIRVALPFGEPILLVKKCWECSVYYTHSVQSSFPVTFEVRKKKMQMIYIDKVALAN